MSVSNFKGCSDSTDWFSGIKFILKDSLRNKEIDLNSIGDTTASPTDGVTCDEVNLSKSDYIKKLFISWDTQGISLVAISTKDGITASFGKIGISQGNYEFND